MQVILSKERQAVSRTLTTQTYRPDSRLVAQRHIQLAQEFLFDILQGLVKTLEAFSALKCSVFSDV